MHEYFYFFILDVGKALWVCYFPYYRATVNAGGDNVHRGMVLGILVGAANKELPEHLKRGLIAFDELQTEIEAFSDIALNGNAI